MVLRRVGLSALRLFACGEPIAFAVHLQDMNVMREAVEERAGEPFRSEHARPFIEWKIAGHQRRAAFIALAEYVEEKLD